MRTANLSKFYCPHTFLSCKVKFKTGQWHDKEMCTFALLPRTETMGTGKGLPYYWMIMEKKQKNRLDAGGKDMLPSQKLFCFWATCTEVYSGKHSHATSYRHHKRYVQRLQQPWNWMATFRTILSRPCSAHMIPVCEFSEVFNSPAMVDRSYVENKIWLILKICLMHLLELCYILIQLSYQALVTILCGQYMSSLPTTPKQIMSN